MTFLCLEGEVVANGRYPVLLGRVSIVSGEDGKGEGQTEREEG